MDTKTMTMLRQKYPYHVPLEVAGELLGGSPRRLSRLIASERQPFASLGANVGIRQRYVRALSYAFRPLTKNEYVSKNKGIVTLLRKGKALFPSEQPLVTTGGGPNGIARICTVSRVAAWLKREGIPSYAERQSEQENYFIPAPRWRRIRPGILSTTRFAGILFLGEDRLAVYDIGDGHIEWQLQAERSLFYRDYGMYETKATGMLLVCNDDCREDTASDIIRMTMWQRKRLIGEENYYERDRPVRYVKSPIRVAWYYERVYLSTPRLLSADLKHIAIENQELNKTAGSYPRLEAKEGDYRNGETCFFFNPITNLLKYVYFFAAVKSLTAARTNAPSSPKYALILSRRDEEIAFMYPDIFEQNVCDFYEYMFLDEINGADESADRVRRSTIIGTLSNRPSTPKAARAGFKRHI